MQGSERREVVSVTQAQPGQPVSATGAPGLSVRVPASAQEAGREGRTLAVLAQKAGAIGQELRAQYQQKEFIKGQMTFQQGKTYQELLESGASYGSVAGFQSMNAAKMTDDLYTELVQEIEQGMYQTDPETFREIMAERFTGLLTGDQMTDNFLTELSAPLARKVAQAHVTAHEAWKVQETKSAAIELLMSKVNSDDPDDKAIVQATLSDDGPLSSLSPEDKKSTILSAVLLDLENGEGRLYEQLGFQEGLRERFSMQAEDEAKVSSAVQAFVSKKENAYNGEFEDRLFTIARAVRNGELDYTTARKMGESLVVEFGKGNKDLVRAETVMQGQANVWLNKMDAARERQAARYDRLLEKEHEEYQKTLELYTKAGNAVNQNMLWSLDKKESEAAWELIKRDIDAQLIQDVQSGVVEPTAVLEEASARMAKAIDKYGVVNENLADELTAAFSRNLVANEQGEVYENVVLAYQGLAKLYEVNPTLALRHLKTDAAKSLFIMAKDMDTDTTHSTGNAIKQAAANMRTGIDPQFVNQFFSKGFNDTLKEAALDKVVRMAPSLKPWTGTARGSVFEISTSELERAATDPRFLANVERVAKTKFLAQTSLLPEQAANLAMHDMLGKAAYMLGNIVVPETDTPLHQILGMPEYQSETGAPHEAIVEFLKERGPEYWGKQWFDTEIASRGSGAFMGYLGTKLQQVVRDVPEMYIDLDQRANGNVLIMQPVLNDGSTGKPMEIPAADLGTFYKAWRDKQRLIPREPVIDTLMTF